MFGLRGDVRMYLYNSGSELVGQEFDAWLVSPTGERSDVRIWLRRGSGRRILGKLDGVDTPEAARDLKDYELVVANEELPPEQEGEWYQRDLLQTPVFDEHDTALGELASIVEGPGMDTWVVQGSGEEVWIHVRLDDLISVEPGVRIVVRQAAVLRLPSAE